MKKIFFTAICCILISVYGLSQVAPPDPLTTEDSLTAIYAEGALSVPAIFPGGKEGWKRHLQLNLNATIPYKNGAPQGIYRVVVMFTVDKDGKVRDFYPETKFGYGMEEEVIRVIKKGPKWEPAVRYDRRVHSYKRQPVIFVYTNRTRP